MRHLIVEVVDLQLVAPAAVGEVEAAVFFSGEQLCVLSLLKERRLVTLISGWRSLQQPGTLSRLNNPWLFEEFGQSRIRRSNTTSKSPV